MVKSVTNIPTLPLRSASRLTQGEARLLNTTGTREKRPGQVRRLQKRPGSVSPSSSRCLENSSEMTARTLTRVEQRRKREAARGRDHSAGGHTSSCVALAGEAAQQLAGRQRNSILHLETKLGAAHLQAGSPGSEEKDSLPFKQHPDATSCDPSRLPSILSSGPSLVKCL